MDKLREADAIVDSLGKAMQTGEGGLRYVPRLLLRVIHEEMWRERIIVQTGQIVHFDRFIDFVTTKPLEGLGADLPTLRRLCHDNLDALTALDQVTAEQKGTRNDLVDNINYVDSPDGTSRAYALRRLRASRPDLHARVIAKELTPHAAMVEAGFRPKTITVPLEVDRVVAALRRHFTEDELRDLARMLIEE